MPHRSAPLLLLTWLLLLALAAALWLFLHGAPATEFGPPPRAVAVETADAGKERGAALPETWTLHGRVRGDRGSALQGAHVELLGRRVDTDAYGKFELLDLPAGEQEVTCWKAGYTLATRRVAPGDKLEIRLAELVRLEGSVLLPDGRSAAGVTVTFRGRGNSLRETRADDLGHFAFERVPAGKGSVHASPLVDHSGAYDRAGAHVVAGSDERVTFTMNPGVAYRGVVRDPTGALVEGAVCRVSVYRDGHTWEPHRVITGPDGTFALAGVPNARTSVIVETPTPERGFRYLRWFVHGADGDSAPLDVRLETGKPIAGRLVTPRGVDFAGNRIWACRIAGNQRNFVTWGVVQADGTFHIGGLWEARYELRLEGANRPADRYVLTAGYRVQSGNTTVSLGLGVARSVAGVVRNSAGDAVVSRSVLIQDPDKGLSLRAVTDDDGRFEVARVPPGDVRVYVLRAGRNAGSIDCGSWRSGDMNIDVRVDE